MGLTFAIFVWVTMTYVWPTPEAALKEGHEILATSKENASVEVQQARRQATEIVARANKKVVALMEDAKKDAKLECDNMIKTAKTHIQQEKNEARANLQAEIVSLVIKGVEKILSKSINNKDNADIISKIIRKG